MALVLSNGPLHSKEVIRWQVTTFRYYNEASFASMWHNVTRQRDCAHNPELWVEDMSTVYRDHLEAMRSFDMPITFVEDKGFVASKVGALTVLRNIGIDAPEGTFRLMDLPAELRTKTYEMVLQLPASGVRFRPGEVRRGYKLTTSTRNFAENFSWASLGTFDKWEFAVRSAANYLNILLANKQIFREAVHCFYKINLFICYDNDGLTEMLRAMGPTRCRYLRHIAVRYAYPSPYEYMPRIFDSKSFIELESSTQLKRLDVWISETSYQKGWSRNNWTITEDASDDIGDFNVPGLQKLRSMRQHVEITFGGECPNIAEAFQVEGLTNTA